MVNRTIERSSRRHGARPLIELVRLFLGLVHLFRRKSDNEDNLCPRPPLMLDDIPFAGLPTRRSSIQHASRPITPFHLPPLPHVRLGSHVCRRQRNPQSRWTRRVQVHARDCRSWVLSRSHLVAELLVQGESSVWGPLVVGSWTDETFRPFSCSPMNFPNDWPSSTLLRLWRVPLVVSWPV